MPYVFFKRVAVDNSTIVTAADFPKPHESVLVELQADCGVIRFTFDGSDPTATSGYRLLPDDEPKLFLMERFFAIRAIAEDAIECGLNVHFYGGRYTDEDEDIVSSSSASSFSSSSSSISTSSSSSSSDSSVSSLSSSSSTSSSASSESSSASSSSSISTSSSSQSDSSSSSSSSSSSQSSSSSSVSSSPSSLSSQSSSSSRSSFSSTSSSSSSVSSLSSSSSSSQSSLSASSQSTSSSSSISTSSSSPSSASSMSSASSSSDSSSSSSSTSSSSGSTSSSSISSVSASGGALNLQAETGAVIQDEAGTDIQLESVRKFVGFNVLSPQFFRSAKHFNDVGPHATVKIPNGSPGGVDADGWPAYGSAGDIWITWDTFITYSWAIGDYDLTVTGGGSITVNQPSGETAPLVTLDASDDRIILYPVGNVDTLSFKPTGTIAKFTSTFLDRAGRSLCVRVMDATFTTNEYTTTPPTSTKPALSVQVASGDGTYYHHGWSWQDVVDLSNDAQCDVWVNYPHTKYGDSSYLADMANKLNECYGKVYVEFSNEAWNSSFSEIYNWIEANRGSQNHDAYHADLTDEIVQAFKVIMGPKCVGVLGSQAVSYGRWSNIFDGSTGVTRPLNYIDAVAIAPYWGGTWALSTDAATILSTSYTDISTIIQSDFDTNWKPNIEQWKTYCDSRGWDLLAYEGGPHMKRYTDQTAIDYLRAYVRSDEAATVLADVLAWWDQLGGGIWCHFVDVDYEEWGAKRTESETSASWELLLGRMN